MPIDNTTKFAIVSIHLLNQRIDFYQSAMQKKDANLVPTSKTLDF